jgi:hypothetical protein
MRKRAAIVQKNPAAASGEPQKDDSEEFWSEEETA